MENQELLEVRAKAQEWLSETYDKETRAQVQALLDNEDTTDLVDSFYRSLEFGTGGLRGVMGVGTNRMNIYTVGAATQGLSNYLKKNFAELKQIKVAIGYDCRNNSRLFSETSAKIFAANGIKAYLFQNTNFLVTASFDLEWGAIKIIAGFNNLVYTTTEDEVKVFAYSSVLPIKINEFKNHFQLKQNYPNPFNPSTTIKYSIPQESHVSLRIYDVLGREIVTLVNREQKAGYYEVDWNAVNNSSGVYFYKIQAGDFVDTKKMILLR